jgi:hypothetical protein
MGARGLLPPQVIQQDWMPSAVITSSLHVVEKPRFPIGKLRTDAPGAAEPQCALYRGYHLVDLLDPWFQGQGVCLMHQGGVAAAPVGLFEAAHVWAGKAQLVHSCLSFLGLAALPA